MRVFHLSAPVAMYGVLSATLAGSQIVVPTIHGFQRQYLDSPQRSDR